MKTVPSLERNKTPAKVKYYRLHDINISFTAPCKIIPPPPCIVKFLKSIKVSLMTPAVRSYHFMFIPVTRLNFLV